MWEPLHLQNYNKKNIKNLLNVNNHYLSLHKLQLVLILTPNNKDNIHKSSNKNVRVLPPLHQLVLPFNFTNYN